MLKACSFKHLDLRYTKFAFRTSQDVIIFFFTMSNSTQRLKPSLIGKADILYNTIS